jgi:hypothetical protein
MLSTRIQTFIATLTPSPDILHVGMEAAYKMNFIKRVFSRWLKSVQSGPVLDDPINGESFRTDVDQVLVPTLKGTVFNNIDAL